MGFVGMIFRPMMGYPHNNPMLVLGGRGLILDQGAEPEVILHDITMI